MRSDTYFNPGAIDSLRELRGRQAILVTDPDAEARGVANEVRAHLDGFGVHVFSSIEPEPAEAQIRAGVEVLDELRPDLLIAVGGGSVIDAANVMRLFHESPDLTLQELTLPFLDYSLVPDMAVVDPRLTLSMPPTLTADTGVDALTHALEAAVSIFASPYTDAFCVQAVNQILPTCRGPSKTARTWGAHGDVKRRDHRGTCLFERVGGGQSRPCARGRRPLWDRPRPRQRHLPGPRPALQRLAADQVHARPGLHGLCGTEKYAQIAWIIGLGGRTEQQRCERLFAQVEKLLDRLQMPRSLEQAGVSRAEFDAALRSWPGRPSPTRASAPIRASRSSSSSPGCSRRASAGTAAAFRSEYGRKWARRPDAGRGAHA